MDRELLRRVRWTNVARAVGVAAVLAAVALWPRLSPAPPVLPPDVPLDAAVPPAIATPAPIATPTPTPTPSGEPTPATRERHRRALRTRRREPRRPVAAGHPPVPRTTGDRGGRRERRRDRVAGGDGRGDAPVGGAPAATVAPDGATEPVIRPSAPVIRPSDPPPSPGPAPAPPGASEFSFELG